MTQVLKQVSRHRPAFTIVELMVVIAIITLLISILMPALRGAYKTALIAADSALIRQISMGCEGYYKDFNEYPISDSIGVVPGTWCQTPIPSNPPNLKYWWPPRPSDAKLNEPRLVGASKVFAALVGFNTLAKDDKNPGCQGYPFTRADYCGDLTYRGILVNNTAVPPNAPITQDKVYGPYFLPSDKEHCFTRVGTDDQAVFCSRFEQEVPSSPAETGAPILYYRARQSPVDLNVDATNAKANVPDSLMDADADYGVDSWEVYRYEDNLAITNPSASDTWQTLTPENRKWHPFYAPSDGLDAQGKRFGYRVDGTPDPDPSHRYHGISRPLPKDSTGPALPSKPTIPYNADSFILISPGPDGKYFTADDITNYR